MDHSFWLQLWEEGRLGFHEGKPNELLVEHAALLPPSSRILVPLCGKAEDMAYLQSLGHHVLGIELSHIAAYDFFSEHKWVPDIEDMGSFTRYEAENICILVGDFMDLNQSIIADWGGINAFYDRAAIVALTKDQREAYAQQLASFMEEGMIGLSIVIEYPHGLMQGPPHSISGELLSSLFPKAKSEALSRMPLGWPGYEDQKDSAWAAYALRF